MKPPDPRRERKKREGPFAAWLVGGVMMVTAGAGCAPWARVLAPPHPLPESVVAYDGAPRPDSEIAVVRSFWAPKQGTYVFLEALDGEAFAQRLGAARSATGGFSRVREIRLLAGPHVVDVGFSYASPWTTAWSSQPVPLRFVARAVHSYLVDAAQMSQETWTAWIVDDATGEVVAGKRPTQ